MSFRHVAPWRALEETENALVNLNNEQERRNRLQEVVRANHTAFELAQIQYKAGLTDFLTVLDSERTLAGDEEQLAQSQVSAITNLPSYIADSPDSRSHRHHAQL